MKRAKVVFATAAIILAGAGALDILGDQSVPTDTVRIAGISGDAATSRSGGFRVDVPRTVSCPIEASAISGG
ncbi:hypothetical protein [Nocardia arizonensis]|uniref:hypothetical protein n=1 Tax=Nocardia arizonensis TaxID=1141647 RepID=UPI0006CF96D5|nr:hypothetical protein [Nocardia arizonensis]